MQIYVNLISNNNASEIRVSSNFNIIATCCIFAVIIGKVYSSTSSFCLRVCIQLSAVNFYRASASMPWQRDLDLPFLSVCPSVRLSLTLWYCVKLLWLPRRHVTSFLSPTVVTKFQGKFRQQGVKYMGWEKLRFSTESAFYLENGTK